MTSEPLNVIEVLASASPDILSKATAPTLLRTASPKSKLPATVRVPDISTFAFMSNVVAFNSISVSDS